MEVLGRPSKGCAPPAELPDAWFGCLSASRRTRHAGISERYDRHLPEEPESGLSTSFEFGRRLVLPRLRLAHLFVGIRGSLVLSKPVDTQAAMAKVDLPGVLRLTVASDWGKPLLERDLAPDIELALRAHSLFDSET